MLAAAPSRGYRRGTAKEYRAVSYYSVATKLQLSNFGPIRRGTIDLKPLTVLIGPNNTGKSVAAMLLYAVTSAATRGIGMGRLPARRLSQLGLSGRDFASALAEARPLAAAPNGPIPPELEQLTDRLIEESLARFTIAVSSEIERCFSSHLDSLARSTTRGTHRWHVAIRNYTPRWALTLALRDEKVQGALTSRPDTQQLCRSVINAMPKRVFRPVDGPDNLVRPDPAREYVRRLQSRLFGDFPRTSYYLPAERSGILQSHRALASGVVRQAPYAGIRDLEVPRLSGVVSDFIGNILEIDPEYVTRLDSLAGELERNLLRGEIKIETDSTDYPEFSYTVGRTEFALHRASSMVSEVAPIVIYLRHLLHPGELCIIEEPESHLHPRSQVILADVVVRLVRRGLRVALTTHSDYFLNQLNNAIRRASIAPAAEDRASAPSEALPATDVAAYLFRGSRGGGVTDILPMTVTGEEGVSDAEFTAVAAELYDETIALEKQIEP